MRLSNILSGAAFRSAFISSIFYLLALTLIGTTIYYIVKSAMMQELESQISEEVVLFTEIYNQGGQSALIKTIKKLENQHSPTPRLIGLFDDTSAKLSGNLNLAPDFIGWKTTKIKMQVSQPALRYHTYAHSIDSTTIVIGRHMKLIDSVLKALSWVLILAGVIVCICSLLTGYFASRRVLFKLNRVTATLDEISQGNTKVRLLTDHSNDQIDRISEQINLYLDQLSSLLLSTRNSAISIAHDLRTPLNRVHLVLQQVKEFDGPNHERMTLIESVESELTNVREIFDTVLRISRIEANKDQSGFEAISSRELLLDMYEIYQAVVEEAEQILIFDPKEKNSDTIFGDKKMLRQLIANLIENAMFHSPKDTQITLANRLDTNREIILEVSDNGPGIPSEDRKNVLDPFYRLNASRNQPGSGLGLALVKAISQRHNAKLELLDNQPGLCVRILFPKIVSTSNSKPKQV